MEYVPERPAVLCGRRNRKERCGGDDPDSQPGWQEWYGGHGSGDPSDHDRRIKKCKKVDL